MKHTKLLHRVTTGALVLLAAAVVISIVAVAIASSRGVEADVTLPISFTPDVDAYALTSDSWGAGEITMVTGEARFEDAPTGPFLASVVVALIVFIVPAFAVLILLRRIFATMVAGAPFDEANGSRIRWIGVLVIVFSVLRWGAEFGLGLFIDSQVHATGLDIVPPYEFDVSNLFLGLVIIGLAEVFRYGHRLQTESDLTV